MKYFDTSELKWQSQGLFGFIVTSALCILAFAVIKAFSFTFSTIVVLAVSIFISALVSQYHARIPNTKIIFEPKDIFAFWGIVWIGVPGGIILGTSASIVGYFAKGRIRKAGFAAVACDVLPVFLSGLIYYLSLGYFKNAEQQAVSGLMVPNEVLFASLFMAIAHYLVRSVLLVLVSTIEIGKPDDQRLKGIFVFPAPAYAVNLLATILLFLTFNHFGIEFGLVVLLLAIAGSIAYEFHSRSLQLHTKQISEASRMHLATVEALATAIDARDQIGVGHVRRTQIYALGLGRVLGLSEDEINALRTGALLHDIGKLAVPDHILNKPGSLTPAEMEKAKIHALVGASILEKVGFPYPVVPTVKYHHEYWDGTGYPERLKGFNIPLTARILTVADVFDTLRAARPYRSANTREYACNFLRSRAGGQFDPKLVNAFLHNLRDFEDEIAAEGLAYGQDTDALIETGIRTEYTERGGYVEQIKSANREVYTLYEMAREFGSSFNLQETLSLFTRKIGQFVPFDTCLVYLLDETNEYGTAVHVEGKNDSALFGKRVKAGDGATGYVLKNLERVENVNPALDFAFCHEDFSDEYIGMVSLPLLADETVIGAVTLYSCKTAVYEEEHLRLLETISLIAADAIHKSVKQAETESYALTDPMTLLPNARSLQKHFEKEAARAKRASTTFQVLVLDLDGFKSVNDSFGHKAGDNMLKEISRVIKEQLREYDFLARYGGDEFVALIPETENSDILELCRRIESAVADYSLPISADSFAKVGVSLGAASYPKHGETFDQMIIAADKAMYSTKAFRKQRKARLEDKMKEPDTAEMIIPPARRTGPEAVVESELVQFSIEDDLVLELDESHIVSYSAIN